MPSSGGLVSRGDCGRRSQPVERILNHGGSRKGNITDGVYNHYAYEAEKRAALELWADALDGILGCGPSEISGFHLRLGSITGADMIQV